MFPGSPIDWHRWQGEIHATILFIIKDGRILLIEKKRGLGAGKINGPGGKIDPGETPLQAAIRETEEELLITPLAPRKIGELRFAMSSCPHILCHVYRADDYRGIPTETEEAVPLWLPIDAIPYDRMWDDDRHWMPMFLNEIPFLGHFVMTEDKVSWQHLVPHHQGYESAE